MLLNVANVSHAFGPKEVLRGVTFRLERREKVALVGRNGSGKTTLLKALVGDLEPEQGAIQLARGATIGYLRQQNPISLTGTVREEAERALQAEIEVKRRLEELERALEHGGSPEELEEYATVHERYLEMEGYAAERDVRMVLSRMGFREEDFEKPAAALSGGERTRLALARQILEEPDLLILDEPTNHLDLNAVEWLEGWLARYPGAVLLVSHDRAFLENVGCRFLELRSGSVRSYPGPFAKFQKLRAEEEERQAEVARRQSEQIAKLDEFVRRFMNSQRTAQARGRLKLKQRLEADRIAAPTSDRGMRAGVRPAKRSGDRVLEAKGLTVRFGERTLFEGLDWTVSIGERWGIVGDNGTGKSTLLKVCLGLREPTEGSTRLGASVDMGYFSQDAEDLDVDESPLEFAMGELGLSPQEARDLLGRFLIEGDDVFRPIGTLSGGERNKLSLARLTSQSPNLLVLDEPTNHLDMDSREALASILKGYAGTLVLISHDRWLLGEVTDRTLHLRRGQPAVQFPGSYAEYRDRREPAGAPPPTAPKGQPAPNPSLSPREISKEIGRCEKRIEEQEEAIAATEQSIAALEDALANLKPDADVLELTRSHAAEKERLEGLMAGWEEACLRLESLRALQG